MRHSEVMDTGRTRLFTVSFLAVFVLAAFLRLYRLDEQGVLFWDSAWYLLVAETFVTLPRWLYSIFQGMDPQTAYEQFFHWGFYPHLSFKPSYILLLTVTRFLSGFMGSHAGILLSPVLGLLTGFIMYKTGQYLTGNRWYGLTAAALTAVSGYQVLYSRQVFPHQLAALALLIFLLFYLKRIALPKDSFSLKEQYLTGLGIGLLLTTHDMMLPIIMVLLLCETGWLIFQFRSLQPVLKRWIITILGLLTPILFWEMVIITLRKIFHFTLHKGYVQPYHQEIFDHLSFHPVEATNYAHGHVDYGYFLRILGHMEGWLFTGFFALGIFIIIAKIYRERSAQWFCFALICGACLGLVTVFPDKMLRLLTPFAPMTILLATIALKAIADFVRPRIAFHPAWIVGPCILLVMVQMGKSSFAFTQMSNGYRAVADAIRHRLLPGEYVATPYRYPNLTLYLGSRAYKFRNGTELKALMQEHNARFIVFDMEREDRLCKVAGDECKAVTSESSFPVAAIEDQLAPYRIGTFDNTFILQFPISWERHYSYELAEKVVQEHEFLDMAKIRLYFVPPNQRDRIFSELSTR